MKIPKISVCVILLLAVACKPQNGGNTNSAPSPSSSSSVVAENGLSGADRQNFYHLERAARFSRTPG